MPTESYHALDDIVIYGLIQSVCHPQTPTAQSLEVVLGAANNTLTLVRYLNRTDSLFEVPTPGILSCTEARHFWVSWHNATLRVGLGYIYSLEVLLEVPVSVELLV